MKVRSYEKPQKVYLTKRRIVSASRRAIQEASERAMDLVGYVIKVDNNWIVRQNKDGSKVKISKLSPAVKPQEIILD